MYGKDVYVTYKGKVECVFVPCTPRTSHEECQRLALRQLKFEEEKREKEEMEYRLNEWRITI